MTYVQQAKELKRRVQFALGVVSRDKEGLTEDEVLFRLNAIEGMLIMAVNDIGRMVRRWEEDAEGVT